MRRPDCRFVAGALITFCLAGPGLATRASADGPPPVPTPSPSTEAERGSFGLGLLDVPSDQRADPRAQTQIVDHVHPGDVIKRRVLLINDTPQPQQFAVYAAAASITNGKFTPADDRAANELTSWISLEQDRVEVPSKGAKGKVPVKLTLRVPSDATPGERYAVVWGQLAAKADDGTVAINMVNRVGIRVYLHVGPGEEPPSGFEIGPATPARDAQGTPSVAIEVRNTGGRAVDITGKVRLSGGPGATRDGTYDAGATTLAPGEVGTVRVSFPRELPDGPWRIDVNLASGRVEHEATGEITFPRPSQRGEPVTLTPSGRTWGLILGPPLGAGLVVVGGLFLLRRRHRRNGHDLTGSAPR